MSASQELVLFDLDGTLLDPDRNIRPATTAVLARLMASGVRVGLATGRGPRSAGPYAHHIGATGPLVLYNGAVVWDVIEDRAVHEQCLPRDDALAAVRIALQHGAHVNTYVGDDVWIAHTSNTSRRSEAKDGVPHRVVGDIAATVLERGVDIVKLMIIDEREPVMRMADPIRDAMKAVCSLVNSEPTYLEILAPGVSKGSALAHVERIYDIPTTRVLAFGDQLNDVELLRAAGLGVAMGNAHPAVRQAADMVIGANDTDAIAAFLRSHFAL